MLTVFTYIVVPACLEGRCPGLFDMLAIHRETTRYLVTKNNGFCCIQNLSSRSFVSPVVYQDVQRDILAFRYESVKTVPFDYSVFVSRMLRCLGAKRSKSQAYVIQKLIVIARSFFYILFKTFLANNTTPIVVFQDRDNDYLRDGNCRS